MKEILSKSVVALLVIAALILGVCESDSFTAQAGCQITGLALFALAAFVGNKIFKDDEVA